MPYPVIVAPFLKVDGITLFPFIFIRKKELLNDKSLIRHEQIHLRQQLELLILPFYLSYLVNYLYNCWKLKNRSNAYLHIIFEQEAYRHEDEPDYLTHRKFWAWLSMIK